MRILLDENIPAKVRFDFGDESEVFSVKYMGWSGKKNGELLQLIAENKFDFFITVDKNLRHQQNLSRYDFTIVLLSAKDNKHQTLQQYIPLVQRLLKEKKYKKFNEITLD